MVGRILGHPCTRSAALAATAIAVGASSAAAQRIGAFGGLNRAGIRGDAPAGAEYSSATGWLAGVILELPVATDVLLSVQPTYARRVTGIAFAIRGEEQPRDSLDVTLAYLSMPVLVKVEAAGGRTFVTGGVDVGVLLDATLAGRGPDEDLAPALTSVDLAAQLGVGVTFPVGRPRLTVELRYAQSLLNLAAGGAAAGGGSLPDRFRTNGFALLAGVLLPLGGD